MMQRLTYMRTVGSFSFFTEERIFIGSPEGRGEHRRSHSARKILQEVGSGKHEMADLCHRA